MLTISLLLTGILGLLQEKTYTIYGPCWREGVFYTVSTCFTSCSRLRLFSSPLDYFSLLSLSFSRRRSNEIQPRHQVTEYHEKLMLLF